MKITQKVRSRLNKQIHPLTRGLQDAIPLEPVFEVLAGEGLVAVQEDGTPWTGFFCGREGRSVFPLVLGGVEVDNARLVVEWFRFDGVDGAARYDFNAYVS